MFMVAGWLRGGSGGPSVTVGEQSQPDPHPGSTRNRAPERDPELLRQARPYDHALFAVERDVPASSASDRRRASHAPPLPPWHGCAVPLRLVGTGSDTARLGFEEGTAWVYALATGAFLRKGNPR